MLRANSRENYEMHFNVGFVENATLSSTKRHSGPQFDSNRVLKNN